MSNFILKYENYWGDILYRFEIYKSADFSKIDDINQVYGLVLKANKQILLVSGDDKQWILPGGGMKKGETLTTTLKREIYEEAAIVVNPNSITPFFFQKVYAIKNNQEKYLGIQVRFICSIEKQDDFIEDPDLGEIKHQLFVDIRDLHKYLKWGETTKFIQKELLQNRLTP